MRRKIIFIALASLGLSAIILSAYAQDAARRWNIDQPRGQHALDPGPTLPTLSFGTGFFVTRDGYILTSNHVIDGCLGVAVKDSEEKYTTASIIAQSKTYDLALLKASLSVATSAAFRTSPPRVGEPIATYGFPYLQDVPPAGNATLGKIVASEGLNGDQYRVQITAPVQPGNNGGPVIDMGGNVLGVIDMTDNAFAVARENKNISDQVNFAIKGIIAANFLEHRGISYQTNPSVPALMTYDLERIKVFAAAIECRTGPIICNAHSSKYSSACSQTSKHDLIQMR